jgi:hypothetical protein
VKNRVVVIAVALLVVFLAGFLPEFSRAQRLEGEVRDVRQQVALSQLRDLAALTFLEASQKNYGLAASTSSQFFTRTRDLANQTADPARKKSLEDLLTVRDQITAELAKGDPAVWNDLQNLFVKTRQATGGL